MTKEDNFKIDALLGGIGFDKMNAESFSEEFTLKNLKISARVLHSWWQYDLLFEKERERDKNHRFSFIEMLWLKIIVELRGFGYPFVAIKKVKEQIFKKQTLAEQYHWSTDEEITQGLYKLYEDKIADKKAFFELFSKPEFLAKIKSIKLTPLHILLQAFLQERIAIKILIIKEGVTGVFVEEEVSPQLRDMMNKESCLTIPVYKLVLDFIENEKNFQSLPQLGIFNKSEMEIVERIRSGGYKTITIEFKNKKPVFIKAEKQIKLQKETRLYEIILKRGFQKILFDTADGEIIYANKTDKLKL